MNHWLNQCHFGDCIEVMRRMPDACVDSIVTDPPYHLTTGKKGGTGPASVDLESPYGRARVTTGFMGMKWDGGNIAQTVGLWVECLRVLKPGGSFGAIMMVPAERHLCFRPTPAPAAAAQVMQLHRARLVRTMNPKTKRAAEL